MTSRLPIRQASRTWLSVCKDVYADVNGDGKTNDSLVCIWNTERTVSVVEAIVDMTNYPAVYSSPDGYASVPQMFRNGQIMIAPGFIGDAAELRDMDDDFGWIHSVVTGISGYKYYEHFYAKRSTDFVSWYTSEEKNFEKKLNAISEIYFDD